MKKSLAMLLTIAMLMNLAITVGFTVSAVGEQIVYNFDTAGTSLAATEYWRNFSSSVTGLATSDGFLNGTAKTATPSILQYTGQDICNADNYNVIKVGFKYTNAVNIATVKPQLDFYRSAVGTTPADTATDPSRRVFASALTATDSPNNIVEVTFNMKDCSLWAGQIRYLIFSPFEAVAASSTFSIDYIKILNVGSYNVSYNANAGTDDVVNMPADVTGKLGGTVVTIDTTVLSRANYAFKGWSLTQNGTTPVTSVTLNDANVTVYAIWELLPPLATEWNFAGTDKSNWTTDVTGTTADGIFAIDASATSSTSFVSPSSLGIDASKYKIVKIGLLHKNTAYASTDAPKIMYKTSSSTWDVANSVTADKKFGSVTSSDFREYTFDFSSSANWKGLISQIKLPIDASGKYYVDYVRIFSAASDDTNRKISFDIGTDPMILTNAPYTISAPTGTSIDLPGNSGFYYTGHIFKGWAISPNSTVSDILPNNYIIPGTDTTLYPVWQLKTVLGVSATIAPTNGSVDVYPKDLAIRFKF